MNFRKIFFLLLALSCFISCGDVPLFTEMKTNRLKVIIKGTLETEDISHFASMQSQAVNGVTMQDDSVDDASGTNDILPTTFMLDIAELRLDGKKFANYRQVHEFSLSGDGSSEPFFNGTGVVLKNDDPGEGLYTSVQVYIRKMIFDNAMIYTQSGTSLTYEEPAEVIFHENDRFGFDFNQLSVNTYVDNLKENAGEILRTFPLEVPIIGGLNYSRKDDETVLEIRFVVKNFVKKYEYDYYNEGIFKVCHFFSFSDWLRDVRAGEIDIGGNLHAVARAYVPGKTAQVTVTAGAGNYVIAIPSTEAVADYGLTNTGISLRNSNVANCDMPLVPSYPGNYIEAVLDYYLKYEQYKIDWNSAVGSCSNFSTYETEWNNYENSVNNFTIAPYVGYSAAGSVIFTNMAPGTYNFYQIASPATYGLLFLSAGFAQIGSTTTVEAGVPITVP